jgi:hypothetical protein
MKFQNIMQTQLVITGLATVLLVIAVLAAVLLFPGVTKCQEITNTAWDDGPNTAPFDQPVPGQGAASSSSTFPSACATGTMAPIDCPRQTTDKQGPSAILIWIGAVLIGIGAIGLYARRPVKHLMRELRYLIEIRKIVRDSHTSAPGD